MSQNGKKMGVCNHYEMIGIHSGEAELELRVAISIFRLAFQHTISVRSVGMRLCLEKTVSLILNSGS